MFMWCAQGLTPALRERLSKTLHEAIPPMMEYLALYDPYVPTIKADLAADLAAYAEKDKSIFEMQADVKRINAQIADIERDVPTSIIVGLFAIDTMAVRKALVEKHQATAKAMLSLISDKVKQRGRSVSDSFQSIQRSLGRALEDVEQVAELEEYIGNLNVEIGELMETLDVMQQENGVLEDCEYPTSDDDFKNFYSTLAWPRRIDDAIEVNAATLSHTALASATRAAATARHRPLIMLVSYMWERRRQRRACAIVALSVSSGGPRTLRCEARRVRGGAACGAGRLQQAACQAREGRQRVWQVSGPR